MGLVCHMYNWIINAYINVGINVKSFKIIWTRKKRECQSKNEEKAGFDGIERIRGSRGSRGSRWKRGNLPRCLSRGVGKKKFTREIPIHCYTQLFTAIPNYTQWVSFRWWWRASEIYLRQGRATGFFDKSSVEFAS